MLPGLVSGFELQTNATDYLAVVMDVLYSQKGAKWAYSDYQSFVRRHFIEVPILIKFIIPNPSVVKPFVNTGHYVAFTFLSRDVYKVDNEDVHEETVSEYMSRVDFGLCFGGGIDILLDKIAFSVGMKYGPGFISVDDDHDDAIKNSVLSFIVGFSWAY